MRPLKPGVTLQVVAQHWQGIQTPEQLAIHRKAGHTKHTRLNGLVGVRLQFLLDLIAIHRAEGIELLSEPGQAPGLKSVIYGSVLIAFVLFEPLGLYGRWLKVRTYLQIFPFYRKGMFKRQKSFQKSDRLK